MRRHRDRLWSVLSGSSATTHKSMPSHHSAELLDRSKNHQPNGGFLTHLLCTLRRGPKHDRHSAKFGGHAARMKSAGAIGKRYGLWIGALSSRGDLSKQGNFVPHHVFSTDGPTARDANVPHDFNHLLPLCHDFRSPGREWPRFVLRWARRWIDLRS